ncbi:MAG TPA: hypothetical protein VGR02_14025 [Thermoanaerobaculia bacterium]|jgi:hypothetical protein|nr:hypothetical protein [Thermoanaerobaculia bacterium]
MKSSLMIALVLVGSSCAASTKQDDLAAVALRSLCANTDLTAQDVTVVTRTSMIVQLFALHQYYLGTAVTAQDVERLMDQEKRLVASFEAGSVQLSGGTQCKCRSVNAREPYIETTMVELSPVMPAQIAGNPTPGIFARVSAGGRPGADFYWIPIVTDAAGPHAGNPVRLNVSDG